MSASPTWRGKADQFARATAGCSFSGSEQQSVYAPQYGHGQDSCACRS
jgi:hypothetical protein